MAIEAWCDKCGERNISIFHECDPKRLERQQRELRRGVMPDDGRRPEAVHVAKPSPVELPGPMKEQKAHLKKIAEATAQPSDLSAVIGGPQEAAELSDRKKCPACGRPLPMSAAERQRKARKRRKRELKD